MMQAPPTQTLPAFCVTSPATLFSSTVSNSDIKVSVLSAGFVIFICNEPFVVRVYVQPEYSIENRNTHKNRII